MDSSGHIDPATPSAHTMPQKSPNCDNLQLEVSNICTQHLH